MGEFDVKRTAKEQSGLFSIVKEILQNRRLIRRLAKNDFRAKFAGSYLGIVWAFVQPVITVLLYWFVFEKALHAGTQSTKAGITVPYVLWLVAGLVPWFYFSDCWVSGTNVLLEYNYLVKKVVFRISVLPVVKMISGLFVHAFFIVFMIVLYGIYGHFPGVILIQIFYYSFCVFVLALGLSYLTGAIVVFFRDLSQIVNILLQVLIWVTPIMWNMEAINMNGTVLRILRLNPMYYVVSGYRDTMVSGTWFFEKPGMTLYFWIVAVVIFLLGTTVFRKLRPHFADVL